MTTGKLAAVSASSTRTTTEQRAEMIAMNSRASAGRVGRALCRGLAGDDLATGNLAFFQSVLVLSVCFCGIRRTFVYAGRS